MEIGLAGGLENLPVREKAHRRHEASKFHGPKSADGPKMADFSLGGGFEKVPIAENATFGRS